MIIAVPRTAGCSAEFANAVDTLQAGKCYRGTAEQVRNHPKNYLFYSRSMRNAKNNYCDSDTYVQNLGPNDAVKLRAFLYSAQVRSHELLYGKDMNSFLQCVSPYFVHFHRVSPSFSPATATRSVACCIFWRIRSAQCDNIISRIYPSSCWCTYIGQLFPRAHGASVQLDTCVCKI